LIISLVVEKSEITKNKECALHILAPAALLSASGACLARTEVETWTACDIYIVRRSAHP